MSPGFSKMKMQLAQPEYKILAIDTATEACSVALNLSGVVTQHLEVAAGHSRRVLGMVGELLAEAGLAPEELDALAVDVGPGSFTGVRIGVGVAQGLAYGAGLKVIPVTSLEALAYAAALGNADNAVSPTPGPGPILAALDARMGQIYYALFQPDAADPGPGPKHRLPPRQLIPPALCAPQHLPPHIGKTPGILGVGNAWERHAPALQDTLAGALTEWLRERHPEAAAVSRLAAAHGLDRAISPLHLTACYVRDQVAEPAKPAAELNPNP